MQPQVVQIRNNIKTFILTAGQTYHRFILAFHATPTLAPMRSILLLTFSLGLLAAASESSSPPKPFDCGTTTEHASEDFLKTVQALHDKSKSGSSAARAALAARDAAATGPINVDAIFHIVATSAAKSSITNNMPSSQLTALNAAYKPYNIQFNLINVTWTTNDTWATGANPADDLAMKQSLRQGSYKTLNLYFQTDLSGSVLGRCTLPSAIANGKTDPTVYANDGCNINAHTMPAVA
ncbi:Extracellular metalloprotease [Pyrenophora seminiperda CCB06]|uniref:Extracellular metalloprotease n=1 Tax=Pyrenophora seminiperda CCB06 TaxID=1302712 RepID=A0A3M7LYF6_9PLEO|nr:Extracellular metalloprotease [Pyrenophora seminiperda CCB06]